MGREEEHGTYWYRHYGRVAQMRTWEAERFQDAAEHRRSNLRKQAIGRLEERRAALEILKAERQQERRRCQLCDMIRAQAWGMGHANWLERRCGRCWARHAEVLSLERHLGSFPSPQQQRKLVTSRRQTLSALPDHKPPSGPLERLPGLLHRALKAKEHQEHIQMQQYLRTHKGLSEGRSRRTTADDIQCFRLNAEDALPLSDWEPLLDLGRPSSAGCILFKVEPSAASPSKTAGSECPLENAEDPSVRSGREKSDESDEASGEEWQGAGEKPKPFQVTERPRQGSTVPESDRPDATGATGATGLGESGSQGVPMDEEEMLSAVRRKDGAALLEMLGPTALTQLLDVVTLPLPEQLIIPEPATSTDKSSHPSHINYPARRTPTGYSMSFADAIQGADKLPTKDSRKRRRQAFAARVAREALGELREREGRWFDQEGETGGRGTGGSTGEQRPITPVVRKTSGVRLGFVSYGSGGMTARSPRGGQDHKPLHRVGYLSVQELYAPTSNTNPYARQPSTTSEAADTPAAGAASPPDAVPATHASLAITMSPDNHTRVCGGGSGVDNHSGGSGGGGGSGVGRGMPPTTQSKHDMLGKSSAHNTNLTKPATAGVRSRAGLLSAFELPNSPASTNLLAIAVDQTAKRPGLIAGQFSSPDPVPSTSDNPAASRGTATPAVSVDSPVHSSASAPPTPYNRTPDHALSPSPLPPTKPRSPPLLHTSSPLSHASTAPSGKGDWVEWERRRQWALEREAVLMLELECCDEVLVYGKTQAERTGALFLSCQLREELAGLARGNRQYRKALNVRLHQQREWAARGRGVEKQALGRLWPPETALPPSEPPCHIDDQRGAWLSARTGAARQHKAGQCPGHRKSKKTLPWTSEGVEERWKRQLEAELMPETIQLAPTVGDKRSGVATLRTVRDCRDLLHQQGSPAPAYSCGAQLPPDVAGAQITGGPAQVRGPTGGPRRVALHASEVPLLDQWHERLYGHRRKVARPFPMYGPQDLVQGTEAAYLMSSEQIFTLCSALDEYRELSRPRPVLPVGMHAAMRATAHAEGVKQPSTSPALEYPRTERPIRTKTLTVDDVGPTGGDTIPMPRHVGKSEPPRHQASLTPSGDAHQQDIPTPTPLQASHTAALSAAGLVPLTGLSSHRLTALIKRLALQPTHPDKAHPSRQTDQAPWKPWKAKTTPVAGLPHPKGWQSIGDYSRYDADWPLVLAKVRSLPLDDWQMQMKKRNEWHGMVAYMRQEYRHANAKADGVEGGVSEHVHAGQDKDTGQAAGKR